MDNWVYVIIVFITVGALLGACSSNPEPAEVTQVVEAEPTVVLENSTESSAIPTDKSTSMSNLPLPERSGPRTQTSGTVPHVQIGVEPVMAVNQADGSDFCLRTYHFCNSTAQNTRLPRPTITSQSKPVSGTVLKKLCENGT